MTKVILTGMNGTVAPMLAERLRREGIVVMAWDRGAVPVDHEGMVRSFIREQQPDGVCHLAMGSPDWAAMLADECRRNGVPFLFTSTCSVFDGSKPGPFPLEMEPNATDDYGRYKAECERRIFAVNPEAVVARLGWQIGNAPGSNNMVDFFYRMAKERGCVEASSGIMHSAACLEDTADALYRLLSLHTSGLYQLEGNPGLSLYEIAIRLQVQLRFPFSIAEKPEPRRDIRMINDKISVRPLTERLAADGEGSISSGQVQ